MLNESKYSVYLINILLLNFRWFYCCCVHLWWLLTPRTQVRQNFTGEGCSNPLECPHFRHQPQVWGSPITHTFVLLATNLWVSTNSSGSIIPRIFYRTQGRAIILQFYYREKIQIRTWKREWCLEPNLEGLQTRSSMTLKNTLPSQYISVWQCTSYCWTGKFIWNFIA